MQRAIYDAVARGDWRFAQTEQQKLFTLVRAVRVGSPPSGVKAALNLLGICEETCAVPVLPLSEAQRNSLSSTLRYLGIEALPAAV